MTWDSIGVNEGGETDTPAFGHFSWHHGFTVIVVLVETEQRHKVNLVLPIKEDTVLKPRFKTSYGLKIPVHLHFGNQFAATLTINVMMTEAVRYGHICRHYCAHKREAGQPLIAEAASRTVFSC
jgi:hypothetical protein